MAKKKKISYASFLAEVEKKETKAEPQQTEEKVENKKNPMIEEKVEASPPEIKGETLPPPRQEEVQKPVEPPTPKTETIVESEAISSPKPEPISVFPKLGKPAVKSVKNFNVGQSGKESEKTNKLVGQIVCFRLGDEEFGVHIGGIREIKNEVQITTFPELPDFVVGVARLRDIIVPVVDLGLRFGFRNEKTDKGSIIMVNVPTGVIGLLVDRLEGTLDLTEEIIFDLPQMFDARESEYMTGVAKIDYRLVTLLDVAKLLENNEVKELKEMQEI